MNVLPAPPATPQGPLLRAATLRTYTPRGPSPAAPEVEAFASAGLGAYEHQLPHPSRYSRPATRGSASLSHGAGRRSGATSSASTQFMPRLSSRGLSPEEDEVAFSGPASPSVDPTAGWLPTSSRETPCPRLSSHSVPSSNPRSPSAATEAVGAGGMSAADVVDAQGFAVSPRQSPSVQPWRSAAWSHGDPVRTVAIRAELLPSSMAALPPPSMGALSNVMAEVKSLHERECRHYAAAMRLRDCENDPMVLSVYREAVELNSAIVTTRALHHRELMTLLQPAVRC